MRSFYDLDLLESQVFGAGPENDLETDSETDFRWDQVEEWETPEGLEGGHTIMLTLTVDGGKQVECRVIGVFLDGEKERIALELPEGGVQIMELGQGEEDGINLTAIEGEEEQERAIDLFLDMFGNGSQQDREEWESESGLTDSDEERESGPEDDVRPESGLRDTAGEPYLNSSRENQKEKKIIESEINHDGD